ncbi:MAG: hypothetical protein D6733_05080 [Methanobacteriota archaeon]|nr:MAG: hypothetical protein D6733_05080 [Euryarchaeota archaeon]
MPELVIIVGCTKEEILDALKMKEALKEAGVDVMGVMTQETQEKGVPPGLIENVLNLKIVANVKPED